MPAPGTRSPPSGSSPMAGPGARRDHRAIDPEPGVPARGATTAASTAPPPVPEPPPQPRTGGRGPAWRVPRTARRLRRRQDDRILGGVAAGLSARIGIDVTVVRVALVLFGLTSGVGVAAYLVAWLLVPEEGQTRAMGARAVADRRGLALAAALLPVVLVALVVGSAAGAPWLDSVAWPAYVSAAGLILVWRNGSPPERATLRRLVAPLSRLGAPGRSRRGWAVRLAGGVLLAAGGVGALMATRRGSSFVPLVGVALVAAGVVVVFGPWWLDLGRQLVAERQARARAEERADMAARVHDSVLQTLAMIQTRADQPQQVVRLARAQERELRSWLFDGRPPGADTEVDATLARALARLQRDVEDAHGVPVEAVVVGDCPLTGDLRALVAAGREAAVNAAKWSGAPVVSVFAEVEPAAVSLFVRDRGVGFDPAAVGPTHRGLAESVHGRLRRHGGTAEVRSAPGAGTEVRLRMPTGGR